MKISKTALCVPCFWASTSINVASFTSEFGMGSGVTKLLWPSQKFVLNKVYKTYVSNYLMQGYQSGQMGQTQESLSYLLA